MPMRHAGTLREVLNYLQLQLLQQHGSALLMDRQDPDDTTPFIGREAELDLVVKQVRLLLHSCCADREPAVTHAPATD